MQGQTNMSYSSAATGFSQRSLSCDPVDCDIQMIGLSAAGSISSVAPLNLIKSDGLRIDDGLSSLLASDAESAPRFGDQQIEPNRSVNVDSKGKSVVECISDSSIMAAVASTSSSLLRSTGSPVKSCQLPGSSSGNLGNSGIQIKGNSGESSSLVSAPSSSGKIMVNGGTSGSGVSSHENSVSHLQMENDLSVDMPSRVNAATDLRVSAQHVGSPFIGSPAEQNPRNWHGIVASSDPFPRADTTFGPFSRSETIGRRSNLSYQQTYPAYTMASTLNAPMHFNFMPHHQYMVPPFCEPLGWGSSATGSYPQNAPGQNLVPSFPGNLPPFLSSGNYNTRGGDFFYPPNSPGVGGNPIRGGVGVRDTWRMGQTSAPFLHGPELVNPSLDSRLWNTPGNVGPSAGAPGFQLISGPMISPPAAFSWMSYETNAVSQRLHGSPDFAPTFYQPDASEFAFHDFNYLPSAPPHAAYWGGIPYGPSIEVPNHYGPGAEILEDGGYTEYDFPLTVQAIAAEGRDHLLSEVLLFLSELRGLRRRFAQPEDLLNRPLRVPWSFLVDMDGDVLDVDEMTYEELLDLEDRMGNVTTGFSNEIILERMQRRKYAPRHEGTSSDNGPCPICREMFASGEDIGKLKCGHDFHTDCIKEWLKLKNLCPICKAVALNL